MNRTAKWMVLLLLTVSATIWAQGVDGKTAPLDGKAAHAEDANPVAYVRNHQSWEYGPFVNYGVGVGERSAYKFLWAGFQVGKAVTPVVKAGIFSGQFEMSGNIMPFWQAYTPASHLENYNCINATTKASYSCELKTGGGTFRGMSITPVIFRWNFLTQSRRIQPWAQAAGGLIYTSHKFPPNYLSDPALGIDGGTSVWNFSPQGGAGVHYFVKPRRSIDLGVNALHISSASLGDRNPGVNASVQFQLGYTYWK
ncbi:acyloxyacyl hydrolase [Telmatobacter bradus]|uniref:acyloxyacyl hydrolase n=1 Tax=Telmatobacter bradus TaxID=474953 RepID=UPI003B42DBAD